MAMFRGPTPLALDGKGRLAIPTKYREMLMQRILVGSASDVEMDASGRILLPSLLRERTRLEKGVVLVGQGNKFEIWSAADWQAQFDAAEHLPAMLNEALQKGEMPDELKGFSL